MSIGTTAGASRRIPRRVLLGAGVVSLGFGPAGCGEQQEVGSCIRGESATDEVQEVPVGDVQPSANEFLSDLGLAVSPDGSRVAANESWHRRALGLTDSYGTVVWDTATGKVVERFGNGRTGAIAWHPDGQRFGRRGTRRHRHHGRPRQTPVAARRPWGRRAVRA